MWIGRKLCATQGSHETWSWCKHSSWQCRDSNQGVSALGKFWTLWTFPLEELQLSKILLIDFRINQTAPLESNHYPYPPLVFQLHISFLKKNNTTSLCKLPGIMLLRMWTFSPLHSLGLCKKTRLSNVTSLSHMRVKTYSQSTVSIILPSNIWEIKQICREILQHSDNVTMSTIISKSHTDGPNHHRSNAAGTIPSQEEFDFLCYYRLEWNKEQQSQEIFFQHSHQKDYLFLLLAILIHALSGKFAKETVSRKCYTTIAASSL